MRHMKKNHLAAAVLGVALLAGTAACGDDDKSSDSTVADTVADTVVDTVADTAVPDTAPAVTDAPSTTAAPVVPSDAFKEFAVAHSAELQAFASSAGVFAGEATTFLSDVSKAPSAAQAKADGDALIAVLPERGVDDQIDLVRDIAEGVVGGIDAAAAGDQSTALAKLTDAQAKSADFSALLTALAG